MTILYRALFMPFMAVLLLLVTRVLEDEPPATTIVTSPGGAYYQYTIHGLAADGVMIPDTPVPTPTMAPTPTPTPDAPVFGAQFRPVIEQWRPLVSQYDWPVDEALQCIDDESDGDPGAINTRTGACGLFQIHPSFPGCEDPGANAAAAYAKWADGGGSWFKHWGFFGGCVP